MDKKSNEKKLAPKKPFMKKRDLATLVAILMVAAAGIAVPAYINNRNAPEDAPEENKMYASIHFLGFKIDQLYLNEDTTYEFEFNPEVVLEVKDGAISFIHSNCPDQVCVNTGWLSRDGDFAACLPNQMLIWVESGEEPETDIIVK